MGHYPAEVLPSVSSFGSSAQPLDHMACHLEIKARTPAEMLGTNINLDDFVPCRKHEKSVPSISRRSQLSIALYPEANPITPVISLCARRSRE